MTWPLLIFMFDYYYCWVRDRQLRIQLKINYVLLQFDNDVQKQNKPKQHSLR